MFDIVEPDLLFISDARRHILTRRNVRGAPDLVVEVRSESTARRDQGVKLKLYDRRGVLEYWVVDPEAEAIRVYRRRGQRLELSQELGGDPEAVLTTAPLPGMSLPLAKIFDQRL
jgi:Uma2 family endonuclease